MDMASKKRKKSNDDEDNEDEDRNKSLKRKSIFERENIFKKPYETHE